MHMYIHPEEVRHGQKVINELITCTMFLMEIKPDAISSMYPRSFIILIISFDSSYKIMTINPMYPWGTSVGSEKFKLNLLNSTPRPN